MDDKIDKLNARIAKMLGKRDNNKSNTPNKPQLGDNDEDEISSISYFIVMLISLVLLWVATGVYYISEGSCGILYKQGTIVGTIMGPKFGMALPYPFSDVTIVDISASDMLPLVENNGNSFVTITKDNVNVNSTVQFSYQITNPLKFYASLIPAPDNLENTVRWQTQLVLHHLLAKIQYAQLHTANLTVLSNKIKDEININLAKYGVSIIKINISSILNVDNGNNDNNDNNGNNDNLNKYSSTNLPKIKLPINVELINEANNYKKNQIEQAKANIVRFNQLLTEYQKNQQTTVAQMYTDTLQQILVKNKPQYQLLPLTLPELIALSKQEGLTKVNTNNNDVRILNRAVVRERSDNGI